MEESRKAHDAPNHGVFQSMKAARLWLIPWGDPDHDTQTA